MTTGKLKVCGTPPTPHPQTPLSSAPLRPLPHNATGTVTSKLDAAKPCRSPGTIQRLKEHSIRILFERLENQWQDLIDLKAQTLGKPTLQVHFKPVAEADKRRIGEEITNKPDLSLEDAMDMATDLLLKVWEGRAKKLIQEFKRVMGSNLVDIAKKRTMRTKVGAMRKAEELCAHPTTPTRPERHQVPVPKTPIQPITCPATADIPAATVPPSGRPATQPPRYGLRVRPLPTVKAKEEARELAATSIRPKRVAKTRPENTETPTRGPNRPATGQPNISRRPNQQTAPAVPTASMRKLSIKDDDLNTFSELGESLIRPLHNYLNDVSEMINKGLVKSKTDTHAVQSIQRASITRVALRSMESRPATAACLPIGSICADVLLEWLSSHADAIQILNSRGLRPIQDALCAVEHAKADHYAQGGLSSKKGRGKAKTGKRAVKNDDYTALDGVANNTTADMKGGPTAGRDLGPARPPAPAIGQWLSKDRKAPKKAVAFSTHNKADRSKSTLESRVSSRPLQISKPQVLPCSDPFVASSPLPPALQPVWMNKTFPPDITGGDLRESILETRDAILRKITTELDILDGSQTFSARQHMILSTYHAGAARLTEELGSLDEIMRRKDGIRHEFASLQKALSCIDIVDSEDVGSDVQ